MYASIYTCAYMLDQQFCYTQRKYKPRSIIDSLPWSVMSESSYRFELSLLLHTSLLEKKPSLSLLSIMSWSKSKEGPLLAVIQLRQFTCVHVCTIALDTERSHAHNNTKISWGKISWSEVKSRNSWKYCATKFGAIPYYCVNTRSFTLAFEG